MNIQSLCTAYSSQRQQAQSTRVAHSAIITCSTCISKFEQQAHAANACHKTMIIPRRSCLTHHKVDCSYATEPHAASQSKGQLSLANRQGSG